ncbi:glycosyltransferase family 4 protein [Micromonospora sp. NPDC000089]|uniref:glycosyltransferase family 4 protein n=1 Tax=unclassified Micromonospora TaxID=2617518 RepID=UPI0036AC6BAF
MSDRVKLKSPAGSDPHPREANQFRVLVVADHFEPGYRAGGTVRTIVDMVSGAGRHVAVTVLTRDRDLGVSAPYPGLSGRWGEHGRSAVFYLDPRRPAQWWNFWRRIRRTRVDVLSLNSVWSPFMVIPVLAARLRFLPVGRILITPHGELEPGALGIKRRKKRLYLTVWRWMLRGRRVLWNATTPMEVAGIRNMVSATARIAVVTEPTGPEPAEPPARAAEEGPARLVFISRISAMKNLDLVLAALALVPTAVRLDIFGPRADEAYWRDCERLMAALPDHVRVTYGGELHPQQVRETFARYDAFVLPTRGENFGHVIAESLSVACPVICSDRTPWTDVLQAGGGVVVAELTPARLAERIEQVASMSAAQRHTARLAAAKAYRGWYERGGRTNVLDQVCAMLRPSDRVAGRD